MEAALPQLKRIATRVPGEAVGDWRERLPAEAGSETQHGSATGQRAPNKLTPEQTRS